MSEPQVWIHSKRFDLSFFIASFLVGPLCYVLYVYLTEGSWKTNLSLTSVTFFFVLFTALFDAPHIFQTFFRTHRDGIEYSRRPRFHTLALLSALLVAYVCYFEGVGGVFVDVLAVYGGWHILRQNTGFVKLYGRLNAEPPQLIKLRIQMTYWVYAFFLLNERNSVENILNLLRPLVIIPPRVLDYLWLLVTLGLLFMAAKMIYVELLKYLSWKKPSAWFFYSAAVYFILLSFLPVHLLIMTALSTIAHDIQYQAWVWTYHQRIRQTTKTAWLWLGATMVLGILICLPLAGGSVIFEEMLSTGYNGLVLWHYFIDGKIWAFSKMPELAVMR